MEKKISESKQKYSTNKSSINEDSYIAKINKVNKNLA